MQLMCFFSVAGLMNPLLLVDRWLPSSLSSCATCTVPTCMAAAESPDVRASARACAWVQTQYKTKSGLCVIRTYLSENSGCGRSSHVLHVRQQLPLSVAALPTFNAPHQLLHRLRPVLVDLHFDAACVHVHGECHNTAQHLISATREVDE